MLYNIAQLDDYRIKSLNLLNHTNSQILKNLNIFFIILLTFYEIHISYNKM